MTSRFQIPPFHLRVFEQIAQLSDSDFAALVSSLEKLPPSIESSDLREAFAPAFPGPEDAGDAVSAFVSARAMMVRTGLSIDDIANDIVEGLETDSSELLSKRLSQLLGIDELTRVAKAIDVMTEHGSIFHDARMFTDVRPVFLDDPGQEPDAAVLVHTLKLTYHKADGGRDSFFIALDSADLNNLREVLDREATKVGSLRKMLSTSMPLLDVTEE